MDGRLVGVVGIELGFLEGFLYVRSREAGFLGSRFYYVVDYRFGNL